MADILCTMCGKPTPEELEYCQFCGTRLKPPSTSSLTDSQPIQAGEDPTIKNTSEFEKVKPATADLVHAGEAPTRQDTAALEPTLPSWLRSLRENQDSAEGKSAAGVSPAQGLPLGPAPATSAGTSADQPDWLSGLEKTASHDQEDIPDWLASLRVENPVTSAPASTSAPEPALNQTGSLSAGVGDGEWVKRLGGESQSTEPETTPQSSLQGERESPDWLETLKSEPSVPIVTEQPVSPQDEELHGWLSDLSGSTEENKPASSQAENLPDWLNQLKDKTVDSEPATREDEGLRAKSDIPDWLSNLGTTPESPEAASGENLPEWLSNLEAKTGPEPVTPAAQEATTGESLPEWLSNLETKTSPEPAAPASKPPATAPISSSELPPANAARDVIPERLSQFKADVKTAEGQVEKKEQFEVTPLRPAKKEGTGPLPEWLVGIERSSTPSAGTPALITSTESTVFGEKADAAFSMEMPDWLSKLIPEQAAEKVFEGDEETATPEDLEVSDLPSWVQAMRPVESVMPQTIAAPKEDAQVTEQSGPLAGLIGVLPTRPGLGPLRKPPAYSTLLQVTDSQQRYAAAFERLISNETEPQIAKRTRLASNRLWRWLIAILLFVAIGLPLLTKVPVTQASKLQPPEMVSAFTLIGSLPSNAPVLVVFDYDPALAGELEAAAAPLMDHLLLQGPRLALISTSPTGPALAERFLHDTSASLLVAGHNYQSGQQYVNLGYLAGGPSGVQYFAISPAGAAPFTLDGKQAWQLPPLQGIHVLSDFSAIIVLTDNADSGRVWIEQTVSTIGNTPLLMVISAQAEPMILPYYDAGQIKGLVTGLAGGEAYGQTFVRPEAQNGLAESYWNSFSAGTLVAEILIILGALWGVISGWRARRNKLGEGI